MWFRICRYEVIWWFGSLISSVEALGHFFWRICRLQCFQAEMGLPQFFKGPRIVNLDKFTWEDLMTMVLSWRLTVELTRPIFQGSSPNCRSQVGWEFSFVRYFPYLFSHSRCCLFVIGCGCYPYSLNLLPGLGFWQ